MSVPKTLINVLFHFKYFWQTWCLSDFTLFWHKIMIHQKIHHAITMPRPVNLSRLWISQMGFNMSQLPCCALILFSETQDDIWLAYSIWSMPVVLEYLSQHLHYMIMNLTCAWTIQIMFTLIHLCLLTCMPLVFVHSLRRDFHFLGMQQELYSLLLFSYWSVHAFLVSVLFHLRFLPTGGRRDANQVSAF